MKKLSFNFRMFLFIALNLVLFTAIAQVPQAINFQAIARDGSGNPLVNTNIQIRLSVIDSAQSGSIVYQELRSLQTNAYGSFSFLIGVNPSYTTIGVFQNIDWKTGNKHLKIDYDPTNTFSFNLSLGTIRFVTVPYAFVSENVTFIDTSGVKNGDALIYNSATGKFAPAQLSDSKVTCEMSARMNADNNILSKLSSDSTVLQTIIDTTNTSLSNEINSRISGDNYLKTKDVLDSAYLKGLIANEISTRINMDNTITNKVISDSTFLKGLIDSVDQSSTNELQKISLSKDTIYLSNNGGFVKLPSNAPAHYVGELYGGGVVFYVDNTGNHGLICSMINLSTGIIWATASYQSTAVPSPGATSEWDEKSNTNAIVAQVGTGNTYAAGLCDAYTNVNYGTGVYSDWYLPTIDILNLLFNAKYFVNKALESDGNSSTTAVSRNYYWSSTEYSNNYVWIFFFERGNAEYDGKYSTNYVRAVREF